MWEWYISGPVIGLSLGALLFFGNKMLGISSSLQHVCAILNKGKLPLLSYDWKTEGLWNLGFVFGLVLSGFWGYLFDKLPEAESINPVTIASLKEVGLTKFNGFMPEELFSGFNGALLLFLGGLLIGFGVRMANGCTSGHGIMGLSLGARSSILALIGFFIGGLIMTFLILPLLL
ncbi:MAG: YeeE/YedE family protein [Flavobacteriaceae bacterium]